MPNSSADTLSERAGLDSERASELAAKTDPKVSVTWAPSAFASARNGLACDREGQARATSWALVWGLSINLCAVRLCRCKVMCVRVEIA